MDSAAVVPPYVAKPLTLRPFRAVMLAPGRVGDPASARALARPYRDVASRLTQWIDRGDAIADAESAIYLHEYTSGGLTIRGLVGALRVSARADSMRDRAVWPHEAIHPEQAGELADRMLQMGLNPAPILLVHHGRPELRRLVDTIAGRQPDWSYIDRAGQRQRLWALRDSGEIASVGDLVAEAQVLLADGHHRYAAYLRLQEAHPGGPWDLGLAMLVDQDDTPLFLGPIHRTLVGVDLAELLTAVGAAGATVDERDRAAALDALDSTHLVLTDGDRWHVANLGGLSGVAAVSWLHDAVVPALEPSIRRIDHHHTVDEALAAAATSRPTVLLPSPEFDQVRRLIESGRLLPEKATSFQPKPSLGVLMRPTTDG